MPSVVGILAYDGDVVDIVVNYLALAIVLLPPLVVATERACARGQHVPLDPPPDDGDKPVDALQLQSDNVEANSFTFSWLVFWWFLVLCILFASQIGVCLGIGCTGISVVWNAFFAHTAYDQYRYRVFSKVQNTTRTWTKRSPALLLAFSGTFVIALDLYYLFTMHLITATVHGTSLLVGIFLSSSFWCVMKL